REVSRLLGVSLYTVDSWTRAVDPKIPGEANLEKLCALLDSRVAGLGKKVASAAGAKRAAPPVSPPAPAPTAERNLKLVASDTQAPTPAPATNLPVLATSFVGRSQAIEEVRRLLETCRLVTLAGTGGIGKTRLAREVGSILGGAFPDGVW